MLRVYLYHQDFVGIKVEFTWVSSIYSRNSIHSTKGSKCEQRVPNCYYSNIVRVSKEIDGLLNNHALWKHGACLAHSVYYTYFYCSPSCQ